MRPASTWGRDPSDVERTVAVFVQLPGAESRRDFDRDAAPPLGGAPEEVASELRAMALEGIGHVQLVVDPITPQGLAALAPILAGLDA
jgi:hypothetical protein